MNDDYYNDTTSTRFVSGCVALYFFGSLCSAAGVGGGTINVPILYFIMGLSFKTAVILSLCTLAGNYLLQVIINIFKKNPIIRTRPLIYYDVVLVLLPAELGGNNIGVIISLIFPQSVLYILAMTVLCIAAFATFHKGQQQYDKETDQLVETTKMSQPILSRPHNSYNNRNSSLARAHSYSGVGDDDDDIDVSSIEYPWFIISIIALVFVCYVGLYIGLNEEQKCTWQYDLILSSIYPLLIAEIVWGISFLSASQRANPDSVVKGDLDWNEFTLIGPCISVVIGFLSGMLGIGGGELMGPMLLNWGVLPAVSVATTSFMSFLNTTSSVLHYLVLGEIPYTYGAIFFGIGCAAGFTGRLTAIYIVRYFHRPSIFVFALVIVLIVSFAIFVFQLVEDYDSFDFKDFCTS